MLRSQLLFWWFLCNSMEMSPVNHFSDIYIYIHDPSTFCFTSPDCSQVYCWQGLSALQTSANTVKNLSDSKHVYLYLEEACWHNSQEKNMNLTTEWTVKQAWFQVWKNLSISHQLSKTRQFRCCKIHLDHHWNCISTYNYDIEVFGYVFLLLCWQINMVCLWLTALTREVHWVCN
jgi:hypothetical protein